MPEKKLVPSRCLKPTSSFRCTAEGTNIHATAMKVSGIIERIASTAAKRAPKRTPSQEGMKNSSMPTNEMPSVHQAMGVWIGVKPLLVSSPNLSAR